MALALATFCLCLAGCTNYRQALALVVPEQRHLDIRGVTQLPSVPLPPVPEPETVSARLPETAQAKELSLDETIRIALANTQVVRVLTGFSASSSGQTIYDPAISNTAIDEARGIFDPTLSVNSNWTRTEVPQAILDPQDPSGASITGTRVDANDVGVALSKRTLVGGTARLEVADNVSRFSPGLFPLNPQNRSSVLMSYTQPLQRGAGVDVNLAPIVIARINTERSYFQFKDSVQELVRGVIEAYWAVVFTRTDVWARRQQVEQGEFAFKLADARLRFGQGNAAAVSQARVALANFRAGLIVSEANQLQREAALRNLIGLPPSDLTRLVLTTAPSPVRVDPKWDEVVKLAEEHRPDLIELKLIIEADQQSLIQANNAARPQLDATLLYRWNGLEGEAPSGARITSAPGQFTDWTLGVNFSVPLGLRKDRASLRRAELVIVRDKANLQQGLHSAVHILAGNVRDLAQDYEQYKAFQETRVAARLNLDLQLAAFRSGSTIYLNVLQAISDWGNAVSSEAQALTQYNADLANLERQTGTILETHGIRFMEERYGSIGPLGRHAEPRCYPRSVPPEPNLDRYPVSTAPAENLLELENPSRPLLPAPRPQLLAPVPPDES